MGADPCRRHISCTSLETADLCISSKAQSSPLGRGVQCGVPGLQVRTLNPAVEGNPSPALSSLCLRTACWSSSSVFLFSAEDLLKHHPQSKDKEEVSWFQNKNTLSTFSPSSRTGPSREKAWVLAGSCLCLPPAALPLMATQAMCLSSFPFGSFTELRRQDCRRDKDFKNLSPR